MPLTAETRGLLDAGRLALLPRGAYLLNSARGGHMVAADVLAALDSGHLAGAALDVFEPEPLPPEHRFWAHPQVVLTPHAASITIPRSAASSHVPADQADHHTKVSANVPNGSRRASGGPTCGRVQAAMGRPMNQARGA